MTKQKSLLILFFCISINAVAQIHNTDSLKSIYTNQSIYRDGYKIMKGGEMLSTKQLSKEFSMSNLGMAQYEKAMKDKKKSTIFSAISLSIGVSNLAILVFSKNDRLSTGLLAGQVAFGIVGSRFRYLSTKNLDRAIWQRNKDLLFPPTQ